MFLFCFAVQGADRDYNRRQAQRYEQEAVNYQRKADGYMREAEDYKRKALNNLNDASYYTKNGKTTQALRSADKARTAIMNYENKLRNAQNAEKTAETYRKKAENLRR